MSEYDYIQGKNRVESILDNHMIIEEKKKFATYILDNNGSREQLLSQVVTLLEGGDAHARD